MITNPGICSLNYQEPYIYQNERKKAGREKKDVGEREKGRGRKKDVGERRRKG